MPLRAFCVREGRGIVEEKPLLHDSTAIVLRPCWSCMLAWSVESEILCAFFARRRKMRGVLLQIMLNDRHDTRRSRLLSDTFASRRKNAGSGSVQLEIMTVPNDAVGLVIGKKGANIREFEQRSGNRTNHGRFWCVIGEKGADSYVFEQKSGHKMVTE